MSRLHALLMLVLGACGSSMAATPSPDAPGTSADAAGSGSGSGSNTDPTAAQLLAAIDTCPTVAGGKFATDEGLAATISICQSANNVALYWRADMDIDCDGKQTAQCNLQADPAYQNQTSATDSHGDPLDAAALPYVVVPSPSSRFDFTAHDLDLGTVVAVIYGGKVEYAVIGDTGPVAIIGEASYATASALGIDPDPSTGGVDSGVAYIAFTGASARVTTMEDHAEAVRVGVARAHALVGP